MMSEVTKGPALINLQMSAYNQAALIISPSEKAWRYQLARKLNRLNESNT